MVAWSKEDILEKMLGLPHPYIVDRIELDEVGLSVRFHVRYGSDEYIDSSGVRYGLYDHAPVREWQHLPLFQYKTMVVCSLPRYMDRDGKVRTIPAPWATERKGYTHLFAAHIIDALMAVKVQSKVAELFRTTPYTVRSIMEEAVERGMQRRGLVPELRCVSIDEKAYARGHSYASILIDGVQGRILDMVEDRTEESARELFLKVTGESVCESIERVNLDMWKPYMKVTREVAPKALQVHDKFHLFKKLSEAIDATRRSEVKQHPELKESRYAVLKNAENRTAKQQEKFQQIDALNLKTAHAWRIRENFKEVFLARDHQELPILLDQWASNALEAGISAVSKVVQTFKRHLQGILNALITGTTSATHERTNGSIQSILAKARGFKSFDRFRINALFYFGKLDLLPIKDLV
jgi:transposase